MQEFFSFICGPRHHHEHRSSPAVGAGSCGPIGDKTEPPALHPDQTTAAAVVAFQSLKFLTFNYSIPNRQLSVISKNSRTMPRSLSLRFSNRSHGDLSGLI